MRGELYDYSEIYVAACGRDFRSFAAGIDHQRNCHVCREEMGVEEPPEGDRADREPDEWEPEP